MRYLAMVALLLLTGCATHLQPTVENISGSYGPPQKGVAPFAYSTVKLQGRSFIWQNISDVVDMSGKQEPPSTGRYDLDGCLLTFHPTSGRTFHQIVTYRHGRFLMWSPREYEEYLRTGQVPDSVLYQQLSKSASHH